MTNVTHAEVCAGQYLLENHKKKEKGKRKKSINDP